MSIRRWRHGSNSERGFALISVLIVALRYFAFLQLLLTESSEAFRAAERYRARVVARIMADNAAELAAEGLVMTVSQKAEGTLPEGRMEATLTQPLAGKFVIDARGEATGSMPASAVGIRCMPWPPRPWSIAASSSAADRPPSRAPCSALRAADPA